MAGWLANGMPSFTTNSGAELITYDTEISGGVAPQTVSCSLQELAILTKFYGNVVDKAQVSGTRYISSFNVGVPALLTGIGALVGGTGGTDKWIFELHSPTGVLLATTDTSGTTAGTAGTWQQIAFTATYNLTQPGTYYLALQSNGTTARFSALNAPTSSGVVTTSVAGTFGTGASITPPTTYTAGVGPVMLPY